MNGKDLLQGMNYVDEKYVAEAECGKKAMSVKVSWLRQIALAACVIILVSGVAVNYGMKQYQYNHRLSANPLHHWTGNDFLPVQMYISPSLSYSHI